LHQESFRTSKEIITRLKRQPTEWEKNFASCLSDRGIRTEKIKHQRANNPINKWTDELDSSQKKYKWTINA
jgi:hypothetical protein